MANNTRVYGRHHPLMCSLATKYQECREPGGVGVESQCSGVHQWASSIILCRHLITFCVNMHFLDGKNQCCSFACANCFPPKLLLVARAMGCRLELAL